jgi:hypothetical protein
MKLPKKNKTAKLALFAGAAALAALAPQAHAQSSDALIDKLVSKGILTADEAKDLRAESDKDFNTALKAKTGLPDWVTSLKFDGDFRGRVDQLSTTDNQTPGDSSNSSDRLRFRYRLRFGVTASLVDNMEVGFRLASGDTAKGYATGNPLSSGTSTFQDNGTKKDIFIDTAYAKWTAINSGDWLLAGTIGKMVNPFNFTPMVFDADYTPEGAAINGSYNLNDHHSIAFAGGAFVLDEEQASTQDPFMYGGQVMLNSKWTSKLSSSVGVGAFQICSPQQLTTANVPYINQGNTRNAAGVLRNDFNPIIGDASATYKLDSFPMYPGAFPIKVGGEIIDNPAASENNLGYWVGVTFGKSGTKRSWDLSYRYEYLQADAWYDQLVDDDAAVYYQNAPVGGAKGYYGGTNLKGHLVKLNYSFTDYLTLSLTGYLTSLIDQRLAGNVNEPNNQVAHFMADLTWKF